MSDEPIKCGTFGGVDIPPDVRARMNHDREAAKQRCICVHAPEQHGSDGCTVSTMMGRPCDCSWDGEL